MAYPSSGSSSSSGFPFGDTTFTKVFVGGLAWETQSDTMRRYFDQFGDILEAVVITDKNTGRSKGYGFVTFQDPESARRACADPTPVIDGRRANCNLASLGRPRPALPSFGRIRSPALYSGGAAAARGAYIGSFGYQNPVSYSYQQGIMYPPYGYASYGPEYVYQQGGVYNPYGGGGQQYLQMYGVPGTVSNVAAAATATAMYHHHPSSYNQLGQTVPSYTPLQGGYTLPGHHQILQFGGGVPSVNAALVTNTPIPTIQSPYHPTGVAGPVPAQPQFILPAAAAAPPQFVQGSGSEQNAG